MNIWTDEADIEAMNPDEWHVYRDDLLDEFLNRGYVLKPNVHCRACDPRDDYTCLGCEIQQVDAKRGI